MGSLRKLPSVQGAAAAAASSPLTAHKHIDGERAGLWRLLGQFRCAARLLPAAWACGYSILVDNREDTVVCWSPPSAACWWQGPRGTRSRTCSTATVCQQLFVRQPSAALRRVSGRKAAISVSTCTHLWPLAATTRMISDVDTWMVRTMQVRKALVHLWQTRHNDCSPSSSTALTMCGTPWAEMTSRTRPTRWPAGC
jgi:hypothetical protein